MVKCINLFPKCILVDEAGATTVVYYVLSKLDVQAAFSDPSYVEANPGCRMFLERKGEQGLGADKDFYVMNYAIAGDTEAFW